MNAKNFIFKTINIIAFSLLGGLYGFAQEAEAIDTISADELFAPKQITQTPLEQCDRIDTCTFVKFAIVTKDGKQGIYDLEKHENVTEIEFEAAEFSRRYFSEDSVVVFYFNVEKGLNSGTIGVLSEDNHTIGVWMDNPKYVAKLDDCTTIDAAITQKCTALLHKGLKSIGGIEGQLAVIDAKTGQLKAWVALEKEANCFVEAKLLKKAYSPRLLAVPYAANELADMKGALNDSIDMNVGIYNVKDKFCIRDHNWRSGGYGVMTYREALVRKSNVAIFNIMMRAEGNEDKAAEAWQKMMHDVKVTNAMEMAALFGSMYNGGKIAIPTLEGDMVDVENFALKPLNRQYLHEILTGLNKADGIQAKYAPKGIELAGVYGNYWGEEHENAERELAEMSFVGVFPAQAPRYSVCVLLHRTNEPHYPGDLAKGMVNELITWLSKH